MKFLVRIKHPTEDHLNGKKKPWEGRAEHRAWVTLYALATRMLFMIAFLVLLITSMHSMWTWILLLLGNLWVYGETLATKEKYYRIGLFDGLHQSTWKDGWQNSANQPHP